MYKTSNILIILSVLLLTSCATRKEGVGIRVINETSRAFESLSFSINNDAKTINYHDLKPGKSSDIQVVDELTFHAYEYDNKSVYFAFDFIGKIENKEVNNSIGLCGNGLNTTTTVKGDFIIRITSIDMDHGRFSCSMSKE